MDPIIFNISLIILSLGFILMVIYITIIITKNTTEIPKIEIPKMTCDTNINENIIYDDRPSITYKKMFEQPSVGFGYQDFDKNDNSSTASFYTNYYTKSNK